jgi:hypothetical protein
VDKHFVYSVGIIVFLILQNIHAKIYKEHIHINIILIKLLSNLRNIYLTLNLPTTTIVAQPFLMFC